MKQPVVMSWSGGKDSSMALYRILQSSEYEIVSLMTTMTRDYERISMHGVRRILLDQQAECLGLKLDRMWIPKSCTNQDYETEMRTCMQSYMERGIRQVVFGDIFLEDVRSYRENNLSKIGMEGIFPLWGNNPAQLARQFIQWGFKAIITCVDTQALDRNLVGREFDDQFLDELPDGVDPCGENGEFHSFVYDGPLFNNPVRLAKGDITIRDDRFAYCELLPISD